MRRSTPREVTRRYRMKYVLALFADESGWEDVSPEEMKAGMEPWNEFEHQVGEGLAAAPGRAAAGSGRPAAQPVAAVARPFRHESGRAVATLIRALGGFDPAEAAAQEAFVVALERWPREGTPDNPGAWITRV